MTRSSPEVAVRVLPVNVLAAEPPVDLHVVVAARPAPVREPRPLDARDGLRRELASDIRSDREQRDVHACEGIRRCLADDVGPATDVDRRSRRAPGREQAQLGDRELPFEEDGDDRPADDAGGSDDGDSERFPGHGTHGSAAFVKRSGTAGV